MVDIGYGLEVLISNIKIAPENPGVYRMLGENDKVLYVGKAKNIKKRIASYSHIDKLPLRLRKMVSEIKRMEFIIVENESKALLLENELIKELEPKYNILLRDDKTFPHLVIDVEAKFPALRKYRGKRNDKSKYFGPFASVGAVNDVLAVVQKVFLLRSCYDGTFNTRKRPCLMHQIKRCSAPCVKKISEEEYRKLVDEAVAFLEGKNAYIQEKLSQKMFEASENMNFEQALIYRDRIKALTNVQNGNMVEYADIKSVDIIAIASRSGIICIQVFFIRSGHNCGNVAYFPRRIIGFENKEILEAFIGNFYTNHILPEEIIISEPIENPEFYEEALKVKIHSYKKGKKAKLIENVLENAEASIERKMAEEASIKNNLNDFMQIFKLPKIPERIEIYDNSHIQGSFAIGAMVVANPDGFDKKNYRKYDIKNPDITNDDFAMMKEVLTRRFNHMSEENRPDVILLDGGLGQLHAVYDALKNFDLKDIVLIAISKGPQRNAGLETYHMMGRESFSLPFQSSIAFYLQNLRDEAHRFAIGTHRDKHGKSVSKSRLDDIEGIGGKRKKDLLNYFGSVEEISKASTKDIEKVNGISKKTAEKIYNYFHK